MARDDDKKDYGYTNAKDANKIISVEEIQPSTLETIDYAFYDFINEYMNLRANTNKGWKKVPIIWSTPERAFLSKNKQEPPIFDDDGTLIYPLISISRTSITKDLNRKGAYFGNSDAHVDSKRGGRVTLARKIVSDKTNNFKVANNIRKRPDINSKDTPVNSTPNDQAHFPRRDKFGKLESSKKIVYETLSIPMPVYLSINYTVNIITEYVQQLNQLLSPFATLGGHINSFAIRRDGHRYETFLQSDLGIGGTIDDITAVERNYESNLNFEVLGYIIGEEPNGDRPKIVKQENAVEVKIPREHVILGDIPEYIDNRGFYRE